MTDHALTSDALSRLTIPDTSPSLTILRRATEKGEEFTVKHEPLAAPPMPPEPEKVRAGRRSHQISTLTDLVRYCSLVKVSSERPIGFYTTVGVDVVLDENSGNEKEAVHCTLERCPEFMRWSAVAGGVALNHEQFVTFLLNNPAAINLATPGSAEPMTGIYSSLRGELVHDADEYLDMQHRAATFTVKRRKRGGVGQPEDKSVEDVPTQFTIAVPILCDDHEPTTFTVLVRMTGTAGAQIQFRLSIQSLDEIVRAHIDTRLAEFASSAGFLCVCGNYQEQPWSEPTLPASIRELMEVQTNLIRAMSQRTGDDAQAAIQSRRT